MELSDCKFRLHKLPSLLSQNKRQELAIIFWLLEPLRKANPQLILKPSFLNNCNSITELDIQTLQYTFQSAHFLLRSMEEDEERDRERKIVEFQAMLELNFKRFKSFAFLWKKLINPRLFAQLPDLQATVIFQGLIYFSRINLSKINPKDILNAEKSFRDELEESTKKGFSRFSVGLKKIWGPLFEGHLKTDQEKSRFLFTILEFFLLKDLLSGSRNQQQIESNKAFSDHYGACHHPSQTISSDLETLFSFFNPKSNHYKIWKHLSPFTTLHLINDLLQVEALKEVTEKVLGAILSDDEMVEQVKNFVPPQFSQDPQPRSDLIYSVYACYLHLYQKEISDELVKLYFQEKSPKGLRLLRLRALEVVLLQRTGEEVGNMEPLLENLRRWSEKTNQQAVGDIMKQGKAQQAFFLQNIKPFEKMNELLRDKEACRILHIDKFFMIPEELKAARYYLFPFVVDNKLPEGQEYQHLEQLVTSNNQNGAANWITQLCNQDQKRGHLRVRIYLGTIAYFQYYNLAKPCQEILNLLSRQNIKEVLKITKDDMLAFNLLCSGGVKGEENDDLSWFFTNEKREGGHAYDLTLRHLMANVLIFVLGCPPRTNHFHTRIFAPQHLSHSIRGPGSTFPNEQDCGYYLTETGEPEIRYPQYAGIFGGSKLFLLAFNMMTWASLTVSLLLDKEKTKHVGEVCLHGHYRSEDSLRGLNHLPDHIVLKKYVLQRPNMFYFWLKQEPNLEQENIEAPFFISQVLYAIWKDLLGSLDSPEKSVYKGTFSNEKETLEYENRVVEAAFKVVMRNHREQRVPYESFLQTTEGIKVIFEQKEKLLKCLTMSIRILSPKIFYEKAVSVHGQYTSLDTFKNFKIYKSIKYLPFLVEVYTWVHDQMAGLFDMSQVLELTFANAIDKLSSEEAKRNGYKLLNKMEKVWNDIVANHPSYQVCRVAQEAGEATIPTFDKNYRLSFLVDPGIDGKEFNHLYRVINNICDLQNKLITVRDPIAFDVKGITTDLESFSVLLHIQDDEDAIGWVKYLAFQIPEEGKTMFDWQGIDHQVFFLFFCFFLFFVFCFFFVFFFLNELRDVFLLEVSTANDLINIFYSSNTDIPLVWSN